MNNKSDSQDKGYNLGHRSRVKKKFLQSKNPHISFQDYEILEMILFLAIPRSDVKKHSKQILEKYSDIANLVSIPNEILLKDPNLSESTVFAIKLVYECGQRILRTNILQNKLFNNWSTIKDYLKLKIGLMSNEIFFVLFLNNSNVMIHEQSFGVGTVDRSSIYIRDLIKTALDVNASKIIISHNHPSGSVQPSREDAILTQDIKNACDLFGIDLVDHIVVSKIDTFSFKKNEIL